MRRPFSILRVLFAFIAVGMPVTTMAAAPRTVHSIQAVATFAHEDDACIRTYVQIAAIRETVKEAGAEPATSGRLLMSVEKKDICSGEFPVTVFNGQGSAILRDEDFDVVPFLASATLNPVLVEMYDWVSETAFSFVVSGQWTGQGGLTDSHSFPAGNPDGPGVLDLQNNRFRDASAAIETAGVDSSRIPIGTLVYAQLASVHWTLMR